MRADSLDRSTFCEITTRRNVSSVLLLGDSLTWGMGQSLLALLGVAAGATDHKAGFQKLARARVPCDERGGLGATSVTVEVAAMPSPGICGGAGREEVARLAAKVVSSDVAVLNFGAHYSGEQAGRRGQDGANASTFLAFVDDVLCLASALRGANRAASRSDAFANIVVWRSTPMGHPGCWGVGKGCHFGSQGRLHCEWYDAPRGGKELEAQHRRWAACTECRGSFNWPLFPGFDRVARDVLEPMGSRFLDVSAMSAPRPDAHTAMRHGMGKLPPDCLHYTVPGVPDWWNALLFGAVSECG